MRGNRIERVTGIDRKTIRTYAKRIEERKANSPGVATGTPDQIPPPRPPAQAKLTTSTCEPHREFIEAQLRFKRNYTAIYQDLVDLHGFAGAYNSVKPRLSIRNFSANLLIDRRPVSRANF